MMQFEITVHCPELETLAYALRGAKVLPDLTPAAPEPVPEIVTAEPDPPTMNPEPPAPVEAAAPAYDKETLVRAAAELMDQGRQQDLLQLLARFNVPSMMALDPSQFAEFGAALKEIGGKL